MGYASEPSREFAMFGISLLLYCHDSLDKRLLKDVVGKLPVLYYTKDIGIYPVLMAFKQDVKRFITIIGVSYDQITVGELSHVLHCILGFCG